MTRRGGRSGWAPGHEPEPSCASNAAREVDAHGRRETARPCFLKQDPIENAGVVGAGTLARVQQMQDGELR